MYSVLQNAFMYSTSNAAVLVTKYVQNTYLCIYCTLYNTNPMQIKITNGLGFTACEWTFSIGTPYQCYASVSSM